MKCFNECNMSGRISQKSRQKVKHISGLCGLRSLIPLLCANLFPSEA